MHGPSSASVTKTFQIGEVAALVDLSQRTIRHWESVGLVTPSARSSGGFRLYSPQDVARIRLLRFMKPLGFSLVEMRELLDIRDELATRAPDDVGDPDALVWPAGPVRGEGQDLAELAVVLQRYAERAEQRLEKLRRYVVEVEAFARRLRAEVDRGHRAGAVPEKARGPSSTATAQG